MSRAFCVPVFGGLLAVGFLMASAGPAPAEPIVNIGTGLSASTEPNVSGSMTLQFTNTGTTADVNAYSLAIMLVQTSGTGSSIPMSAFWSAPAGPALIDGDAEYTPTTPLGFSADIPPITIGGTVYSDYYLVQGSARDLVNYPLGAVAKNVGLLSFTMDAPGTWDVYVVNGANVMTLAPASALQALDLGPPLDVTTYGFGNLAATDGSYLKVGEIIVVPEPSGIALAAAAAAAVLVSGVRRRLVGPAGAG